MTSRAKLQFNTQAIFWLMLTLGMTLAYVRGIDVAGLQMGLMLAAVAFAAGGAIGLAAGKLADGLFWALLITLLAYLSVLGGKVPSQQVAYGWASSGPSAGRSAACECPSRSSWGPR
jgi:hypothetical protein